MGLDLSELLNQYRYSKKKPHEEVVKISKYSAKGRIAKTPASLLNRTAVVKLRYSPLYTLPKHLEYMEKERSSHDGEKVKPKAFTEDGRKLHITKFENGSAIKEFSKYDDSLKKEEKEKEKKYFKIMYSPERAWCFDVKKKSSVKNMEDHTKKFMKEFQKKMGTEMDWVSTVHNDTQTLHSHITIRGLRDDKKELFIHNTMVGHGMRQIASDILTRELGHRTQREIDKVKESYISSLRITKTDKELYGRRTKDGNVRAKTKFELNRIKFLKELGIIERKNLKYYLKDNFLDQLSYYEKVQWMKSATSRIKGEKNFFVWDSSSPVFSAVLFKKNDREEFEDKPFLVLRDGNNFVYIDGLKAEELLKEDPTIGEKIVVIKGNPKEQNYTQAELEDLLKDSFSKELKKQRAIINEPLNIDGAWHNLFLKGDKPGKKNVGYIGSLDKNNIPHGTIHNFKTNEFIYWRPPKELKKLWKDLLDKNPNIITLSENEKTSKGSKNFVSSNTKDEKDKLLEWEEVAKKAEAEWQSLLPEGNFKATHPYLVKKGVKGHFGVTLDSHGKLVVPLRDTEDKIWSLQKIDDVGTKRFTKNGRTKGCFYEFPSFDKAKPLVIAEGYATAASIYETTGLPTVCALNAGNMVVVAKSLREKFPDRTILIAADNDHVKEEKGEKNVGKEIGELIAKEINAYLLLPKFEKQENGTDWNDLAISRGKGELIRQIEASIKGHGLDINIVLLKEKKEKEAELER